MSNHKHKLLGEGMGDSGPPAVSVPLWVPIRKNTRITALSEKSTKSADESIAFIYDKQTWADEKEWAFFTRELHTSSLEKVPRNVFIWFTTYRNPLKHNTAILLHKLAHSSLKSPCKNNELIDFYLSHTPSVLLLFLSCLCYYWEQVPRVWLHRMLQVPV